MNELPPGAIDALRGFLDEDVRSGDLTTDLMGPLTAEAVGTVYAKCKTIVAGVKEAVAVATMTGLEHKILVFEGNWVSPSAAILKLTGQARTLLTVERVILNIMMRMSGIAAKTYRMLEAARRGNPSIMVAATRKTTPGFRFFEKRAVQIGGGDTHRYALDDMVLIKNNHITAMGGVSQAVRAAKESVSFSKKISCEVSSLSETLEAVEGGANIVLLDNLTPKQIKNIHEVLQERGLRNRIILEGSGGMDEDNAEEYAKSGLDVISSGALTHSYDSADLNMILQF
ncbi:carboxylating nicotinate-nucleotide diphosphorylase [Candidatus Thorarchaeota archaeon]|jgi:nicotinate-nucleotide pyrophosphorylase (carboxylating)|nr:MAG: carboxylating nicotinate-nucleotide diphosphorylase [Candidatus Thorarchaeota archaeon]